MGQDHQKLVAAELDNVQVVLRVAYTTFFRGRTFLLRSARWHAWGISPYSSLGAISADSACALSPIAQRQ